MTSNRQNISPRSLRPRWPAPTATSPSTPPPGSWGYTLDQSKAEPLNAGEHVHRHADGDLVRRHREPDHHVTITGANDAATITASATEDTAVTEAGGGPMRRPGDRDAAGGTLTVHDVDPAEYFPAVAPARWPAPTATSPSIRPPGRGATRSTSKPDGTAQRRPAVTRHADGDLVRRHREPDHHVTITGANDAATITATATEDTAVTEAGGGPTPRAATERGGPR